MKVNQLVILFISITILMACNSDANNSQPAEGEMISEFKPTQPVDVPENNYTPEPIKSEADKLQEEGWENQDFGDGMMPDCYNYAPKFGTLDNELSVSVGGGTNVVIKVMSTTSGHCIRYVYINSGGVYKIKNVPEDTYYLKIAYGKNWVSKTDNGQCSGKFTESALYQKGEDILDFNRQQDLDGYSIPSFSLKLDVISGSVENTFNSDTISENDFNN
jgi:hypothetical protein